MTHARTLSATPAADPIHAAIRRHRAAYDAFQAAPAGDDHAEAIAANDDYDAASDALVATACTTRFGVLALLEHLHWWLAEEAAFKAGYQPAYGTAETRVADLALFLGTDLSATAIPRAFPSGRVAPASTRLLPGVDRYHQQAPSALPNEALPGEAEPWQAVAPVRPDTAHVRSPRFLDLVANALAAVVIVGGGVVLTRGGARVELRRGRR